MKQIDIFISHKSADVALAKELYYYLRSIGYEVFESDESLPKLGSSDYRKEIDKALDECRHMIVVGSTVEYIKSSWVEAEWGFFINEKRSSRKQGNIVTVITENLKIDDLPPSLRNYEVIGYSKTNFSRIAEFMGADSPPIADSTFRDKYLVWIKKSKKTSTLLALFFIIGVFTYVFYSYTQPFDATIVLKPENTIAINSNYPAFEGGELSLFPTNKVETKQIVPSQEIVFKQIPASLKGKKVIAKLNSDFWKLSNDTIVLEKELTLRIIPNGKLANIFGRVIDVNGISIPNCKVLIDSDTTTFTDSSGVFRLKLPYKMQKQKYILSVSKNDYLPQRLDYFAGSGNIDIILKP